jgi:microcystin-dependent protein
LIIIPPIALLIRGYLNNYDQFCVPDLRGNTPIHGGEGKHHGAKGGEETVIIAVNGIPQHTHILNLTNDGTTQANQTGNILAQVSI